MDQRKNESKSSAERGKRPGFNKILIEKILEDEQLASNPKKDLFHLVIEYLPDQIYLKDTQGRFILCNTPVALNAGCTVPEEVIGKTDFNFYPTEDAKRFLLDEKTVMESSHTLINHEEHYIDKKTSELKWNLTTKVPIKDDANIVIGLLGINRDITDMKNAVLEREKIMADLVQRNKDLEEFTYIVSHNLRHPVANILGLLGLVEDAAIDENDRQTAINGIGVSVKKLDKIINDLNSILEIKKDD